MRRGRASIWILGLLLTLPAAAAAAPVAVEVHTVSGIRLGRLVGDSRGDTSYFLLTDVARHHESGHAFPPGRGLSPYWVTEMDLKRRMFSVIATSVGRRSMLDAPKKPTTPVVCSRT